ncbi:hypothetical protein [Armatimonas rosea]|uniref:Uncharacterized protein n=1 Tax=Armatimonas rosea TaxID=685828 RepID=A0A7W9SN30_ARMRO|nr:hypothetical protein [Armatimonas rosea]MBB6048883.1 hypothetical protein [Armatimonas rosea]
MKQPKRNPLLLYMAAGIAILFSVLMTRSIEKQSAGVEFELEPLKKPGTVTPQGDKIYASSGRVQPDPFAEPEEARKYMRKIALRYNSYRELPEADQRLFRGLGGGQGELIYAFMRKEALHLKTSTGTK